MNEALKAQSQKLILISEELKRAAAHAKIAAGHFDSGEVPRACAHTLATEGHIHVIQDLLKEVAKAHGLKAMLS
jgi:hypothetical protein